MQVHPPPGHLVVHAVLRQVADRADVRAAQVRAQPVRAHPEDVERYGSGEPRQQVRAGHPAPPDRLVDAHGRRPELAGVAVPGVDDAVLDDGRRGGPAVPHQVVEVRDVHEQQVVAVGHRVPAARGRPAARGVVLEEHRRHVAAGLRPSQRSVSSISSGRCSTTTSTSASASSAGDVSTATAGQSQAAGRPPPHGPRSGSVGTR